MSKPSLSRHSTLLVAVVLAFVLRPVPARAEMGMASPSEAKAASPVNLASVVPFFSATNAAHVANGCSLRNSATCSFNVRGIPKGSKIIKAFLYWGYTSTFGTASFLQKHIFFDGFLIAGKLIGNGADACWCGGTNVVYRANVTFFVLLTRNVTHTVGVPVGANPLTSGENPWSHTVCPTKSTQGLPDGASLVVVYTNPAETGTTIIYDAPLAGTEWFGTTLSYTLNGVPTPKGGSTVFTEIGGDGQVGAGYLATTAAFETTSINGTIIAGPSGIDPDSDWNGTDGVPLNQLWDTHSHGIHGILAGGTDTVAITSATDCLIGVANVLTVR